MFSSAETGENANQSNVTVENETDIPFHKLTLETISGDGLSWNSDIDAPPDFSPSSSSSETDSDSDTAPQSFAPTTKRKTSNHHHDKENNNDDDDDDPAHDPWNAVCVFGLRVYSKGPPSSSHAKIEVVNNSNSNRNRNRKQNGRNVKGENKDGEGEDKEKERGFRKSDDDDKKKLDVDDQAADATGMLQRGSKDTRDEREGGGEGEGEVVVSKGVVWEEESK